jgi:hypothetical protein
MRALVAALVEPLGELGFRKRSGEVFTGALADDVVGWLGLNVGHRSDGVLEVYPVVGVRHQGLERVVAEALGEKFHPSVPPTVSVPLSGLMEGRYRAWQLADVTEVAAAAAGISSAVAAAGLEFMRSHVDPHALVAALEAGLSATPEQRAMRLPVALELAGETARAIAVTGAELDRLDGRVDAAAERFRRFAIGFSSAS